MTRTDKSFMICARSLMDCSMLRTSLSLSSARTSMVSTFMVCTHPATFRQHCCYCCLPLRSANICFAERSCTCAQCATKHHGFLLPHPQCMKVCCNSTSQQQQGWTTSCANASYSQPCVTCCILSMLHCMEVTWGENVICICKKC